MFCKIRSNSVQALEAIKYTERESFNPTNEISFALRMEKILILERFSNDCRKTKTKVITLTNHNRNKQRHEPIRIPSNYL